MNSMLPRGTRTFKCGSDETTIDLAIASDELNKKTICCEIHDVEHGLDHWAIVSTFYEQTAPTLCK